MLKRPGFQLAPITDEEVCSLIEDRSFPFSSGLDKSLPLARCEVYTLWEGKAFLYVGVGGRGLNHDVEHTKMKGLRDRLDTHWRGRRSGDAFRVYLCDRRSRRFGKWKTQS